MSESTPRITAEYLQQFSHKTVRILGKVTQLRGEQATIDAGGQIQVHLNRVFSCHFIPPQSRYWFSFATVPIVYPSSSSTSLSYLPCSYKSNQTRLISFLPPRLFKLSCILKTKSKTNS